uniref:YrdC-like domain-containing protein n=1 Tax=Leersia perrieri TaxID=77586 RepID=A0A0D9VQV6_9ORYZ
MKACAKVAGERLPLARAPAARQPLARSFVKVRKLSSQHETKSVVSCSVRASDNVTHRLEATAEHILPATNDHVLKAIESINRGQVIAVPTDTIYGFACDAWLVFLKSTFCIRSFDLQMCFNLLLFHVNSNFAPSAMI